MENTQTKRIVETGLMLSMAIVLSLIQFPGPWINGGSITLLSMLPLCIVSYKHGFIWGFCAGGVFGMLQLMLGLDAVRGVSMLTFIGAFVLDYFLAFACLGFSGIFRNKLKKPAFDFGAGIILGMFLRFICHFLSGILLWASITEIGLFPTLSFSFVYNASYMFPEMILTLIGGLLLIKLLPKQVL